MLTHISMVLVLIIILIITFDDVDFKHLDNYDKLNLSVIVTGVFLVVGSILL